MHKRMAGHLCAPGGARRLQTDISAELAEFVSASAASSSPPRISTGNPMCNTAAVCRVSCTCSIPHTLALTDYVGNRQ